MDRISKLPDALLLQILSFAQPKDRVATSVLSKRWETLWMLVPKLEYHLGCRSDSQFVSRSLLLHRAPVLESLCLDIDKIYSNPLDIGIWVRTAVDHGVRELNIKYSDNEDPIRLPRNFYTCQTLVVLKLKNVSLVDFSSNSSSVCFRPLKILHLLKVKYSDEKSVETILSSCSNLKDLVVECCPNDNVLIFTIKVPTLQSLSLDRSSKYHEKNGLGFEISAPSLKYLNVIDYNSSFCLAEDMPELLEANVDVVYDKIDKLLGSLTSVKRLSICSTNSNNAYDVKTGFHNLVHVKICTCETEWLNLLMCLLRDSPNIRALKLDQCHKLRVHEPRPCWNEPRSVPECLLSSLETLEWVKYEGTEEENEVAAFILRSASLLKKATISSKSTDPIKKLEMLKKLSLSFRRSPTCQLAFD